MNSPTTDEHMLNSLLAGFLISSLPPRDQLIPRQWLHRLHPNPDKCQSGAVEKQQCEVENRKRDILLRNFLISLLNPKLPNIFDDPPPSDSLPDSEDEISALQYPSTEWARDLEASQTSDTVDQKSSYKVCTPSEFFSMQPLPCNGAFCYGAVFSDLSAKVPIPKE